MRIVLLPAKPRFAHALMDGSKKVEYRKAPFPDHVTNVVVYASSPSQRILGYFVVHEIVRDSPERIWRKYGGVGCISRQEFAAYYDGVAKAVALIVGTVWTLPEPLPLSALGMGHRAPQSYAYLNAAEFETIRSHRHHVAQPI